MWPKDDPLTNNSRARGSGEGERRKTKLKMLGSTIWLRCWCKKSTVSFPAAHVPVLQLSDLFCLISVSRSLGALLVWPENARNWSENAGIRLKMIPLVPMMYHTRLSWGRRDTVVSLISDEKSHMKCGSLWGNYPRKHDIFSSESPRLMLVFCPLSWSRNCPRRKMSLEGEVSAL